MHLLPLNRQLLELPQRMRSTTHHNLNSQTTGRLIIDTEYKRAFEVRENTASVYFSNRHKDDREWMVLGSACQLMHTASLRTPYFATKSEGPDFQIFDQDGTSLGGVEIAEVLRPDDARHQRFKQVEGAEILKLKPQPPLAPLAEPWEPMRTLMHKKSLKAYPPNTSLLIYLDMWCHSFPMRNKPVHLQLLDEHLRLPFEGCDQFTEVLVLDSGMESLVRLNPDPALIFSTRTDR